MTATIQPACHEYDANYIYDKFGLTPFFALDSVVKANSGTTKVPFKSNDERWTAQLRYQDSGVIPPDNGKTPSGVNWSLHEPREYRIDVERHESEDETGQQSFNCHVKPRWQGMTAEDDYGNIHQINIPDDIEEAINIRVQGSNIHFLRYRHLIKDAFKALDINPKYVAKPHEHSNLGDGERYVRLPGNVSGPIHARDGPLVKMGHLLEHDRQGYRKLVQNDDDEHGNNLPGYYHTVTLAEKRIREAFPNHSLPKESKHYYARQALKLPDDHPLANPKVGASFQRSLHDEKYGVSDEELEQLIHELDQTVLSILNEAGINIHSTDEFIAEPYFDAELTEDGPQPISLDLTQVKHEQENIVVRYLSDGLSPVQWEAIETLVTDGGEIAPADIAERNDRHIESVYRALADMDDLVHREYSKVALKSDYIAEMVHEAVTEAQDAVKRAADTSAKAMHAAERGMDETMSAFIAWAARNGIDVNGKRDARMILRFNEKPSQKVLSRTLKFGLDRWRKVGLDEKRYREAQVRFGTESLGVCWEHLR